MHTPIPTDRLNMPIGEAMFTQRSTRKLRPDPIPLALAEQSREQLAALGYAIEWHQYAMPHSVSAEEIAEIARWLGRVLGA